MEQVREHQSSATGFKGFDESESPVVPAINHTWMKNTFKEFCNPGSVVEIVTTTERCSGTCECRNCPFTGPRDSSNPQWKECTAEERRIISDRIGTRSAGVTRGAQTLDTWMGNTKWYGANSGVADKDVSGRLPVTPRKIHTVYMYILYYMSCLTGKRPSSNMPTRTLRELVLQNPGTRAACCSRLRSVQRQWRLSSTPPTWLRQDTTGSSCSSCRPRKVFVNLSTLSIYLSIYRPNVV